MGVGSIHARKKKGWYTMKNINDISNREEIVEALADQLMQFDKELNSYQTDVSMYIDEETGAATLDTFINIGGRSWLEDDHKTIYTDKEHFESMYDRFCNDGDFAAFLNMENNDLKNEVVKYLADIGGINEDEAEDYNPTWHETRDYIETRPDYIEKLEYAYNDEIENNRRDYLEKAEEIIEQAEE